MLVAPVASSDKAEQVYLPSGTWYRFGNDEKFEGNKVIWAGSPLNDLPVFIKAGAIIPMQNVIQSTADKGDGMLHLNIWYGDISNNFTYYEDDGITYRYRQGAYYERIISFNPYDHEITMNNVQGDYGTRFNSIELILHGFPAGSNYTVNGQSEKTVVNGSVQVISFQNENGKTSVRW
jgi:alpha-glucosidase